MCELQDSCQTEHCLLNTSSEEMRVELVNKEKQSLHSSWQMAAGWTQCLSFQGDWK